MDKFELIGKINSLLDRTKMGIIIWSENHSGIYSNKTNDVFIGNDGIQFGIKDGFQLDKIIVDCPELRDRLYMTAIKSAIQNHKTFDELNPNSTVVKNNPISFQFLNSLNFKLLIHSPPFSKLNFIQGFADIEGLGNRVEYIYCNEKNSQYITSLFGIGWNSIVVGHVNVLWGATIQIIEDIPDYCVFICAGDCTIPNGIVKMSI